MDVLHACCAGLDVHKRTVVACVRRVDPAGKVVKNIKTFATMTGTSSPCRLARRPGGHVGRDGVDRHLLETGLQPPGAAVRGRPGQRPSHQAGPGRKTDVKDSEWIAQLLQHGLFRPSFIPPRPTRELRDLTRQRTQLVRREDRGCQPDPEGLEDANIKLGSVASNVLGVSGRDMIEAIIRGEYDPVKLAELARRRLRGKIPQLRGVAGFGDGAPPFPAADPDGPPGPSGAADRSVQ